MEIILTPAAEEDLASWVKSGNKTILKRIAKLVESIQSHPFDGLGKPEALKHELTGTWSRRISKEHRIVYEIHDNKIIVHSLRGHYK